MSLTLLAWISKTHIIIWITNLSQCLMDFLTNDQPNGASENKATQLIKPNKLGNYDRLPKPDRGSDLTQVFIGESPLKPEIGLLRELPPA
jgi:hypothetical protein